MAKMTEWERQKAIEAERAKRMPRIESMRAEVERWRDILGVMPKGHSDLTVNRERAAVISEVTRLEKAINEEIDAINSAENVEL